MRRMDEDEVRSRAKHAGAVITSFASNPRFVPVRSRSLRSSASFNRPSTVGPTFADPSQQREPSIITSSLLIHIYIYKRPPPVHVQAS